MCKHRHHTAKCGTGGKARRSGRYLPCCGSTCRPGSSSFPRCIGRGNNGLIPQTRCVEAGGRGKPICVVNTATLYVGLQQFPLTLCVPSNTHHVPKNPRAVVVSSGDPAVHQQPAVALCRSGAQRITLWKEKLCALFESAGRILDSHLNLKVDIHSNSKYVFLNSQK